MSESTFTFDEFTEMYPEDAGEILAMIQVQETGPVAYAIFHETRCRIQESLFSSGIHMDSILTPVHPGFCSNGVRTIAEWTSLIEDTYCLVDQLLHIGDRRE